MPSPSPDLPAAYVSEHLDLGYAMTAHRAQGRTVDSAHAYITADTTREPLYVMATRGREANLLYVDTTYDPDRGTAHEDLPETDPLTVLRGALVNGAADISALQTRADEAATDTSPSRVAAEGAALHALARERRYTTALLAAGYTGEDIEAAKAAGHWRPLIAKLRTAEGVGLAPASAVTLSAADSVTPSVCRLDEALGRWIDRHHRQGRNVDSHGTRWANEAQRSFEPQL